MQKIPDRAYVGPRACHGRGPGIRAPRRPLRPDRPWPRQCHWCNLSCEPLLDPVSLLVGLKAGIACNPLDGIGWIICGKESGPKTRPTEKPGRGAALAAILDARERRQG